MSEQVYSLRRVQETLGLSRAVVVRLVAAGFVSPTRGPRNAYRFSFRDLMLLRTAHALREARVPPRRILRSLMRLRTRLPADMPLSGLRITAVGADVAVREGGGAWNAESGQLLIDFEVRAPEAGRLAVLTRPAARDSADESASAGDDDGGSAEALVAQGRACLALDPAAAEPAFRAALVLHPAHLQACLELGVLLSEQARPAEALAVFDAGLAHHPAEPLLHFNRAVACEDARHPDDALAGYERAIALDPALADAHYNAGRLAEQRGDAQRALRHFSAYRRLTPRGQGR